MGNCSQPRRSAQRLSVRSVLSGLTAIVLIGLTLPGCATRYSPETVRKEIVRQRGSHIRLRDATGARPPLTIPDHRELKSGLLRRLLRDAGMSFEEFIRALD